MGYFNSDKAVMNRICLHCVKMVSLVEKKNPPVVILYIPIAVQNWPAVDCLN